MFRRYPLVLAMAMLLIAGGSGSALAQEELFVSTDFTEPGGFTSGVEGPACDSDGNLYVVNYARQGTIGKVTPEGACRVFVELPNGSIGNGIRFHSDGFMLIADYIHHNILHICGYDHAAG